MQTVAKNIVNSTEKKTERSAATRELKNLTRGKWRRKMAYFIHSFLQVFDEDDIFIHSFLPQGFRMGVQADQPQWDLEVALEGCEGISINKCKTDYGMKGCEGT